MRDEFILAYQTETVKDGVKNVKILIEKVKELDLDGFVIIIK